MQAQRSNESPSGAFKRQNGLAPARWRGFAPTSSAASGAYASTPPLLRHKHTKSEILAPYAPQISDFDLLSPFSPGAYLPFSGGCGAATRPSGRERNPDAPQKGASIPAMRPVKSTQKGTLQQGSVALKFSAAALLHALQRCCQPFEMLERSVRFGARKFKFSHFFGLLLRVRSGRPLHIYRPTRVQLNRSCTGSGEVQRRHAYDECPQKFRQTDP